MTRFNNDVTGDRLINNKGDKKKYDEGYDRIFGKGDKDTDNELVEMFKHGPTETITLSDEDFYRFLEMLDNPPEPNENLKALFEQYKMWEKGYEH